MSSLNSTLVNSTLAAIQIASTDASARIEAAVESATLQAQAEVQVATIRGTDDITIANIQAAASEQNAQGEGQWHIAVANIDSAWHNQVATTEATSRETVATTDANAQMTSATTASNAQRAVAITSANAQTTSASTQAAATVEAATIDASWHQGVALTQANAQIQCAQIDATAKTEVATTEYDGVVFKSNNDVNITNIHETAETLRLNLKLAFANDKWTQMLPIIDEALGIASTGVGDLGSSGGTIGFTASGGSGLRMKGQKPKMGFGDTAIMAELGQEVGTYWSRKVNAATPLYMGSGDVKTGGIGFATGSSVADAAAATQMPFISTSGVLTPAQIQAQVNAAYARNDAKVAGDIAKLTQDMSGQGFSAQSPILQALRVGLQGQGLRASMEAETKIRFETAKLNADAIMAGQVAISDQFIKQEGMMLEHEKNEVTRSVGIISAVCNLIGSAI